jgi:hypothetical protein
MIHFALSHNVMSHVTPEEGTEYHSFSQIIFLVICQVICVSDHQDAVTVTLYTNLWNFGVKKFYSIERSPCFPQSPIPTV